ncbi:unnamed protein product [Rhodiola kirilowii]
MAEEIAAFEHNGTMDHLPFPTGVRPITCKWIYRVNTRSDGSLERYKRVSWHVDSCTFGHDYEEIFAPLAHMTTIRTLFVVASVWHWSIS